MCEGVQCVVYVCAHTQMCTCASILWYEVGGYAQRKNSIRSLSKVSAMPVPNQSFKDESISFSGWFITVHEIYYIILGWKIQQYIV